MRRVLSVQGVMVAVALGWVGVTRGEAVRPGDGAVWAARTDRVSFRAEAGESLRQTGPVVVEPGARFEKTGAGKMTLETARISGSGDFDLTVREGILGVSRGTASALPAPDALLAKAAFWLDATKNVVETNDDALGTYVAEWRDRRETAETAPFAYPHAYTMKMPMAASVSSEIAALRPRRATGAFGAAVDFGGYGSYCLLAFQTANAGSAPATQDDMLRLSSYDTFVVHSVTRAGDGKALGGYGFVFGAADNSYHPSVAGFTLEKYIIRSEYQQQMDARWWLNGTEVDASATAAKLGDYVFDTKHYGCLPTIDGLYHYMTTEASLYKRNGGDLVYEMLVFTNRLTEAEHAQVRRYLTDKYGQTPPSGAKTVRLAEGTRLETGDGLDDVAVKGAGEIVKATDSDLTWHYAPDAIYGGFFAPTADDAGTTSFREDVALDLAQGGVLSADAAAGKTNGRTVSFASGDATALVKTGLLNAHVLAVPLGVTALKVETGVLTVSPERAPASVSGVLPEATMANPDFQLNNPTSVKWLSGHKSGNPSTINGWTCIYTPDWEKMDAYAVITPFVNGDPNWYMNVGSKTNDTSDAWLALRGGVQVYTTIQVLADGRYEVAFDLCHDGGQSCPALTLWIGPDTNSLVCVGGAATFAHRVWTRKRVRTPRLKAGASLLAFRQDSASKVMQSYHFIDNVAVTPLTEDADAFDVPNGDFERFVANQALAGVRSSNISSREFGALLSEGWQYVQPTGTNVTASGTAVNGEMFFDVTQSKTVRTCSYFNKTFADSGEGQLLLGAKDAKALTTFRMPAGTWRLRADLATWRRASLTAKMKPETAPGAISAAVKIGDATTDLGSLTLKGLKAFRDSWATAFTVPEGGADVELSLWVTSEKCAATVDNLVCVPVATDVNLVADGDFDKAFSAATWQADISRRTGANTPCGRVAAYRGTVNAAEPDLSEYDKVTEGWDGATTGGFGLIGDCGTLAQTLTLPEDGRYRLSYATRMRYNGAGAVDIRFRYGFNAFRCFLAAGGVTNVLDETSVATTNWVRHTAVFTAKAGTYRFGFAGLNVPTKTAADTKLCSGWDKRGFVDGVSIVRERTPAPTAVTFPEDFTVSVSDGAKLRLGFAATNRVKCVRLGGKKRTGIISRETQPNYILGDGAFEVERHGAVLIIR